MTTKIIILGPKCVGKTSLIEKYIHEKYIEIFSPSIGIEVNVKMINESNEKHKLLIYDTSGEEKFIDMVQSFIRYTHYAIFVYDVTDPERSSKYLNKLFSLKDFHFNYFLLLGNKSDLVEDVTAFKLPCLTNSLINNTDILRHKYISIKYSDLNEIDKLFEIIMNNNKYYISNNSDNNKNRSCSMYEMFSSLNNITIKSIKK